MQLGRDVVLKVLPAAMACDRMAGLVQREACTIVSLNHPHIVTIFSVEEADGIHFPSMELVEGEPAAIYAEWGKPDRLAPFSATWTSGPCKTTCSLRCSRGGCG